MRIRSLLIALPAVLITAASISVAETVVLMHEASAGMMDETDGSLDARLLLAFDLDIIPRDARIQYAGLSLYDEAGPPWEAPFVPVVVAAITRDWEASNASWENLADDWDLSLSAYRVLVSRARIPAKFLLTDIVEKWVDGEIPNYGLVAMIEEVADLQDVVRHFNAEALKPSLKIRYFLLSEDSP